MKGGLAAAAAAAAMVNGVAASHQRHAHDALFKRHANATDGICTPSCTTIYNTYLGPETYMPIQTRTLMTTATAPVPKHTPVHTHSPKKHHHVPPPVAHHCPTIGDYTFPATTITVYATKTVCPLAPHSGTHTGAPWATHTGGPTPNGTVVVHPGVYVAPKQVVHVTVKDFIFYCPFTRHHADSATPTPATLTATTTAHPTTTEDCDDAPMTTSSSAPFTPVPPPPPAVKDEPKPAPQPAPAPAPAPAPVKDEPKPAPKPPAPAPVKDEPKSTPTPPAPAPVKDEPKSTPTPPASKPPAPKPHQPATGGDGLSSDNDHLGITYTLFRPNDASCKSAEEVDTEIASIKGAGFSVVRLYSPECDALKLVGDASKKHGLKLIVGVFVKASGCDINTPEIKLQVDQLVAWDSWDLVNLVVVGNEAIMNSFCSAPQLAALVVAVKEKVSVKYNGHFTVSETLNIWLRPDVSAAICPVIPVTGANIHSFFNPSIAPEMSGVFVKAQLDILATICPGNEVINLECGYPSSGKTNGLAVPGPSQQAAAIKSIREIVGHKTVFFAFQNELWKGQSECECETSFGCAELFDMKISYN
ncbi:hypothetical protein E4U42_007918 [Claviceps africana]|uniref:Probable beta-glucosidase btgE n=1 Tax=Claviceps africana TaxID=83212 RepID=A0A8K0NFW6_9HYPO|nr:hypothetical protein E4U42_007918 [Claviceps africana]